MAVARFDLRNASAARRAATLACFAAVSALLSTYYTDPVPAKVWDAPLFPGMYFATVIAIAFLLWRSRSLIEAVLIVFFLTLAWIAAYRSAVSVFDYVMSVLREIAKAPDPAVPNFLMALCGAIGGVVGSSLTAAAVAIFAKEFRAFDNWGKTVMIGTAAGSLLEFNLGKSDAALPIHIGSVLPLFLVWQTAVAASVGFSLLPRETSKPTAAAPFDASLTEVP